MNRSAKVFGLGLSKTGTSSLSEALNQLGIKALHYPCDARTEAELRSGSYRLSILDEYQALVDIPVAPFYAQLDRAYPGSKFILTTREIESWLRSAELHWQLMMDWWQHYPDFKRFTEFISACVYGTIGFSRERFAFVYRTHLDNVQRYFAARPDDLLVLDICGGQGWERLCPFLGLAAPDRPFPHANEWMHQLLQAGQELDRLIPCGATLILIDQAAFGGGFGAGRRCLPLTERDGSYYGPPSDDSAALAEFERLRAAGAEWLVIGWPAFWWLDYYVGLQAALQTRFHCALSNERLIIFDLRDDAATRPTSSR